MFSISLEKRKKNSLGFRVARKFECYSTSLKKEINHTWNEAPLRPEAHGELGSVLSFCFNHTVFTLQRTKFSVLGEPSTVLTSGGKGTDALVLANNCIEMVKLRVSTHSFR